MKNMEAEYVWNALKSKLDAGDMVKAVNTWPAPLLSYAVDRVKC